MLLLPSSFASSRAAQPINYENWVTHADYPYEAYVAGQRGIQWFELAVDEQGKAFRCRLLLKSGVSGLDDALCPLMIKRARFKPALDEHGRPISVAFVSRMNWGSVPNPDKVAPRPPDLVVKVTRMPAGRRTADAIVSQIENLDGSVTGCTVTQSSHLAMLDKLACDQARVAAQSEPFMDEDGHPMRVMRSRLINFVSLR
jgi:outer membrane biosynthesis protein TonB